MPRIPLRVLLGMRTRLRMLLKTLSEMNIGRWWRLPQLSQKGYIEGKSSFSQTMFYYGHF